MAETETLALPLLEAGQAQKHVTVNEALRQLDAMVQLAVASVATAPPGSPVDGARHIVGDGASGGWSGRDGDIALRRDGVWVFVTPQPGFVAFNRATGRLLFCAEDGWVDLFASAAFDHVARIGVGTLADAGSPLSVRAGAVLHSAVYAADGGSGDAQHKINKETASDTASLLFQTGFSGRAEIGLTGNDDLHLKVSADGSAWTDAVVVSRDNGHWGIGGATPDSMALPALITGQLSAADGSGALGCSAFRDADMAAGIYMRRARGTPGAPTAVLAGHRLFIMTGAGYRSSADWSANVAAFDAAAEEDFTGSANGSRFNFATTPIGSTTRRTVMQVRGNGALHLLPVASAPASPEDGQLYYDSALGKFRGRAAGAWVDLH